MPCLHCSHPSKLLTFCLFGNIVGFWWEIWRASGDKIQNTALRWLLIYSHSSKRSHSVSLEIWLVLDEKNKEHQTARSKTLLRGGSSTAIRQNLSHSVSWSSPSLSSLLLPYSDRQGLLLSLNDDEKMTCLARMAWMTYMDITCLTWSGWWWEDHTKCEQFWRMTLVSGDAKVVSLLN